jgi:hypothetical protein
MNIQLKKSGSEMVGDSRIMSWCCIALRKKAESDECQEKCTLPHRSRRLNALRLHDRPDSGHSNSFGGRLEREKGV